MSKESVLVGTQSMGKSFSHSKSLSESTMIHKHLIESVDADSISCQEIPPGMPVSHSTTTANQMARIICSKRKPEAYPVRSGLPKVKRNDKCPCGSGKKFKSCCLKKLRSQS
jgi:preprotein translocase subunit SecA